MAKFNHNFLFDQRQNIRGNYRFRQGGNSNKFSDIESDFFLVAQGLD